MTCLAEGGYLAIINSEQEANILKEIVENNPDEEKRYSVSGSVLVGFHDWGEHGTFLSINSKYIRVLICSLSTIRFQILIIY